MKSNNYSPLRYPGGKSRLIDFIKSIIDQNSLKGGTYIEPFSGGAAIALALRYKLKDKNGNSIDLWDALEVVPINKDKPKLGAKLQIKPGITKNGW